MIRAQLADGTILEFPDGTPDDVVDRTVKSHIAGSTAPPEEKKPHHPMSSYGEGAMRGVGQGLLSLVDVPAYARTIGAVARVPERIARTATGDLAEGRSLVDDATALVKGVGNLGGAAIGLQGAEAMGEAHGNLLTGTIPIGGLLGKLKKLDRTGNLLKAAGVSDKAGIAKIERLVAEGRMNEVPVAATRGSFVDKLDEIAEKSAGPQLDRAKAGLQNIPASVDDAITGLKGEREVSRGLPQQVTVQPRTPAGLTAQKPAAVTTTVIEEGSGNPALVSAMDKQIDELIRLAGVDKKMSADQIQKFKEQAQAAGKYTAAPGTGATEAATAAAAETTAAKLRELLETSPDIPENVRVDLKKANNRMEDLESLRKPAEDRRLLDAKKPLVTRSIEGLLGRGVVPQLVGAGTGMAAAGPLGAAAVIGAGAFTQSVLFNTLSAAAKLKVAKIMQTEGVQAAVQAAFAAHITSNAARRQGAATP